jgi:K+-transporting ATPase ATPase A chain
MTTAGWAQIIVFCAVVLLLARPVGAHMTRVFAGERTFLSPVLGPVERAFYAAAGVDPNADQRWTGYAAAMLAFNLTGFLALYALLRLQDMLPLNPQGMAAMPPDLALNTAVSFTTNTNWQGYGGESTLGYLAQMAGLTVQNFLSAATGIALAVAMIRGFARRTAEDLGNFWADMTRCVLYILLPIALLFAVFLVWQGIPQNLSPYVEATTLEGGRQTIAQGPVASQVAIKMLGTNGGGFFNANSAHPYENPTALSNFVQMLSIFLIPAGLCFTFGRMVQDRRQGWTIFVAMALLFVAGAVAAISFEQQGNPQFSALGVDQAASAIQAGGNMEGKDTRFGIAATALFATITTDASCGAIIGWHDSFTPLGGMVPLINMQLGEVVFGGVGTGLYGMLIFAILAVFIAGLMIGRTPEYLGKKIEAYEMKMSSIAILVTPLLVLAGTAIAVMSEAGHAGIANPGAHGFSEILYAFTSAGNNNGSAFGGLSANTPFYNVMLAIAMWFGRFGVIVPVLAIAGSLAAKKRIAATGGTMPTHGMLFVVLLVGTVLLVGLLNYVPALALGPVVEHLVLWK